MDGKPYMKRAIEFLCVILFLSTGCGTKSSLVNEHNIDTIKIAASRGDTENVTDLKKIQEITHTLNNAEIEPAYFKAEITLTFVYHDKRKMLVMFNGRRLKINGVTYIINKTIDEIVNQ